MAATPKGAMFLKAVNTSGSYKNAEYIAGAINDGASTVGMNHVVQVVTDSAPACRAAGRILEERYPHITATGCVAHMIDLFLEDIGKIDLVADLVKRAKAVCRVICNHHAADAAFKLHSPKNILRPGDTRFATVFVMLQRLEEVKRALQRTVTDQSWDDFYHRWDFL